MKELSAEYDGSAGDDNRYRCERLRRRTPESDAGGGVESASVARAFEVVVGEGDGATLVVHSAVNATIAESVRVTTICRSANTRVVPMGRSSSAIRNGSVFC